MTLWQSNSKEHDNSLSGTAIDAQDNYVYIAWSKISQNNTGSKNIFRLF